VLQGEVSASVEPSDVISYLAKLSGIFQLGFKIEGKASVEKSGKITSNYGEKDAAVKFLRVDVQIYDTDVIEILGRDRRVFYVAEKLKCRGEGITGTPIYMHEVSVKTDEDLLAVFDFTQLYPNLKPMSEYGNVVPPQFQIYQWGGGIPYLISVNSNKAYERIIAEFQKQTLDLSIAAILVSLFNSSCPDMDIDGRNARTMCNELLESTTLSSTDIPM
jgi:hypothetical protein